ncbi:bridge-like lipid transfer protein family member 3B isoform X1 [Gadus morhua]|uniref:bridge-like lipid transfer protein family member 3B isoform X1 n=2 Tax=Gadus morhua TaxID=8049 RepID=UPI0011B7E86C|nr:UHRF1-binding protein 1-like isoform X1 [Gadus morhua]
MAGLIKKQILKHLSRFAKNLSPDKINLSTLKGEGQLTNLELDEEVLQSLLDLPTWLAINRVGCNKATIRIPWTKLKTHPISLTLDKVVMEMSTCDEPRPPNGPSPIATASGQSEYGFAEKVVEGMSLSINSIVVRISAKAFNASFELSQLQVYSVNTSWSLSDLRFTRITDPQRGEILTFKEISWQMIRIEADAIQSAEHEMLSAPIRLITNQSKIRVTLKRRMKDCYVVASKLVLILDDLLWVLTDSQLKAMVQYAKSLSEAMERSAQQRKSMASEEQGSSPPPTQQVRTAASSAAADQTASMARLFSAYDVCETSHHLQITHLDLHICDDTHSPDKVSNKRLTGGAMQLSFSLITLDYYPLHRAGDSCLHWMHYSEATKAREGWARSLLDEFKVNVELLKGVVRDQQGPSAAQGSPQHGKISTGSTSFSPPPPQSPKTQLMSSSVVLRMADFCIYQVSTADQRRSSPKAMVSCNKKTLYLPPEMPAVHVEFTEYYFPDGKDYPIPCPNLYVQLNALQLVLDPGSLVWLNLFALDLRQSLEQFMDLYKLDASQKPDEHVDIKVDGLMLKLVVPTERDASYPPDLPRSVSVQTSEMVATNTRHHPSCGRTHLQALLTAFQQEAFFCSSSGHAFPRGGPSPSDQGPSFDLLHPAFWRHAQERDTPLNGVYAGTGGPAALSGHALRPAAAADVWALHFAQFWVDYEGKGRRPQPFVDSFPLAVWACQPGGAPPPRPEASLSRSGSEEALGRLQRKRLLKEYYSTEGGAEPGAGPAPPPSNGLQEPRDPTSADVHVLVHVQKHLSAQVSHRQYMFLMRLQRSLKALQQTLQTDLEAMGSKRDRKDQRSTSTSSPSTPTPPTPSSPPGDPDPRLFGVCLGLLLRSAEVALLLQPVAPQGGGSSSSLGSELSPSESRGTLGPGSDGGGGEACGVDQMLCGGAPEGGGTAPLLLPTAARPAPTDPQRRKASLEERGQGGRSFDDGGVADGLTGGEEQDPLDPTPKMPQSVSSGRLMKERSQSSFSVSYKTVKKSPSLQSLDNISIDSYLMEDTDLERDDVSISGFKDTVSEQSTTESANEAAIGAEQEGGVSPDTVSAASQSIDEPTKDLVSVLVLKVEAVCGAVAVEGDSTAVALQVGQVRPSQLGNISLRQYLSNRSLGMVCSVPIPAAQSTPGGGGPVEVEPPGPRGPPEVQARLESGPCAAARSPLAERSGFLQLRLHGYRGGFLSSTLQNLAHFLEDKSAPQVLPLEISVRDTHVDLKDDSARDNPSEPEPNPISVHVDRLLIHRRDDGSFSIGVDTADESKVRPLIDCPLSPVPETVGVFQGVAMATQTQAPPTCIPIQSNHEKMLVEENECLKVELSRAKMALAEAQMEKDSLLHQMRNLKMTS